MSFRKSFAVRIQKERRVLHKSGLNERKRKNAKESGSVNERGSARSVAKRKRRSVVEKNEAEMIIAVVQGHGDVRDHEADTARRKVAAGVVTGKLVIC